ncbi:MAG: hypothetical protein WBK77_02130 [Alphaproteobacteria bacterium]
MKDNQKKIPPHIGSLVLLTDIGGAAAIWFLREDILGPGQDMIAAIVAGCLVMGGVVAFMIFRNLSRRVL